VDYRLRVLNDFDLHTGRRDHALFLEDFRWVGKEPLFQGGVGPRLGDQLVPLMPEVLCHDASPPR